MGIATVAKSATGRYTITLSDPYIRLMHVSVLHVDATTTDLTWQVASEDVDVAKTIVIVSKAAAVDTEPASGTRLLIRIDLKNTSADE
jgi:hypothetical protein